MTSLPGLIISFGVSTIWILGYFCSWRIIAFVGAIPPSFLTIILCLYPETPYWLVEKGRDDEALESLKFFRLSEDNIEDELISMQERHIEKKMRGSSESWSWLFRRLMSPAFLKPFICIGFLPALSILRGYSVLLNYLNEFMVESGSNINPKVETLTIGILRIVLVGKVLIHLTEVL